MNELKVNFTPPRLEVRFGDITIQGNVQVRPLSATENGTYIEENVAYSPVVVDVDGLVPTGTLEITENGTYNVAEKEFAHVEVPQPQGNINITENGTINVTDYETANVNVPQGVIVPDGMAYYNGYLLPRIPYADGYNYAWIRRNEQTDNWDLILGTSQWRSKSSASLDNWSLEFANQAQDKSRQYSIPISGDTTTATDWGEYIESTNSYGTNSNRKVVWASHDIMISTSTNILYRHGIAIESY